MQDPIQLICIECNNRTSIIVGFPGETDKEFEELLKFIQDVRFDRLGAFIYSREEGTPAGLFKNQIPEKIKQERFDRIMKLQEELSRENNGEKLGKITRVLIEEKITDSNNEFIGRTYMDAPEVDGVIYVEGEKLTIGEFADVKIIDTLEYDLVGKAI
ncbi:MiaB-like tRNA modifying enzyme YliG [Candidatus Omnitrophus magneticus]|uniref:MiaB-like tRNA modifying enzyme YliG n=1 Tax=Candidatus Omnitrophus magneticus TaxID=1609969 RepID=A0A0F0CUR5_9BACT|nr:MiaB-like tRNA modifying enzyme YliG [Candidatus Omnitrophus magneticus]